MSVLEFMKFSVNQEDARKKWLDSENELMRLQNQLSEVRKMNSKLELQYHHATVLLKSEIKVRTQVQEDKKNLVNCLFCLFVPAFQIFSCFSLFCLVCRRSSFK